MPDTIRVEKNDLKKTAIIYAENLREITTNRVLELRKTYNLANFKIEVKREPLRT